MSAGKVLALVVVVASFAIVAVAVSWCCWCVRSRFGTADKSIQAVKSVATVADTMDSSARAAKSSLLSATFPTTATTATMTHPRATASEPRMLNPAAEVDAPVKQSLPPFTSAIYPSVAESACTTPSTTDAAKTPEVPTPKPAESRATSLLPKATQPDDNDQLWKPFPGVSDGLQRRISKVDLFICEDNTATPQSVRRSSQISARGSGADGLKLTKLEAGTEHASAVKALELGDCDEESASSIFESASATTPSRRNSESTESVTGSLLGNAEAERKFLDHKSTRQCGSGTLPGGSSATQPTPECRTLAVLNPSEQRSSRIPTDRTGPTMGCEELMFPKQQPKAPSSPYKDTSQVASAARGPLYTAVRGKKDGERRPSFMMPMESDKFEGFTKARGATTRPTKRAGGKLLEKAGVKQTESLWAGKRSLLRKAQKAAALSPRKGSGTPEVSIVINVPKKEMSLLEVTKEQMLASANPCSATAKKESL
ncbi:uncharacterized protein LOC119464826 [Dermacentor silvarum]|uniref:uncharacterized protein LOC119464826 n=1 Tax=Dermacentor silvarum TaxID=543639 RepID=UPI001898E396|nr:uncharacterized protein LOC119464826 [Dermacentor silvarum]